MVSCALQNPVPRVAAGLLLLVVLGGIGCGGRQRPAGDRRTAHKDIEVRFIGNREYGGKRLKRGLSLQRAIHAGRSFDQFLVSTDEERLRGFYLRRGYFDVRVTSSADDQGDKVVVTFRIDEGPRARVLRVDIVGLPDDPEIDRERLLEILGLEPGDHFRYEDYELAKPLLVQELERAGYAHATLDAGVAADRIRHEAIIRLRFDPGPLSQFGQVTLVGVSGHLADAARARIRFDEGDRYSITRLEETQAVLYEMGRFSVVRVDPDRTVRGPVVPVTIRVALAERNELRLGGGFGVDPESFDVHGRAGYRIAGWPRPLITSRLELRPALVMIRQDRELEPRVEALAGMERLDLLRVPLLRADAEVSFSYLVWEAYTSVGPRVQLGLRYPVLLPELHLGAAWNFRMLDFRDIHPVIDATTAESLGLDVDTYRLGFFEQSLIVDLRDSPIGTRRGLYGELRVEEGTVAAGGTFSYLRLTPELRGYLPLPARVVIAGRLRVGGLRGDLPITQRYFSGGASSHRGFGERRLAPVVTGTVDGEERSVVVGGGGLVESNFEIRAPLGTVRKFPIGGVLFVDGGDVDQRLRDIDVGNLHWAAGGGLRVHTPVGPLRVDLGYRLNRVDGLDPLERLAFHLNIGEAF